MFIQISRQFSNFEFISCAIWIGQLGFFDKIFIVIELSNNMNKIKYDKNTEIIIPN